MGLICPKLNGQSINVIFDRLAALSECLFRWTKRHTIPPCQTVKSAIFFVIES